MKAIEDLKSEHEVIIRALDILEALSPRFDDGMLEGLPDLNVLRDFIQKFIGQWHQAKEEEALFPALRKAGLSRENGPVGIMLREHRLGRHYFRAMKQSLLDTSPPNLASSFANFRRHTARYIKLLREHSHKENIMLFHLVEKMFTQNRLAVLQDTFERVELKKGGKRQAARYCKTLDALSGKYGKTVDNT